MRIFVILLLCLNLLYLAWNLGLVAAVVGGEDVETVVVRSPAKNAPQKLQLISELNLETSSFETVEAGGVGRVEEIIPVRDEGVETLPVVVLSPQYCLLFGALSTEEESSELISLLEAHGYNASEELVDVEGEPDYWVYIPSIELLEARNNILTRVKALNIDAYVIDGGIIDQGISLGLFSSLAPATDFQQKVLAEDFSVEVMEIPRTSSEIWVSVEGLDANTFPLTQWLAILESLPELKQVEKLCETIAPQL